MVSSVREHTFVVHRFCQARNRGKIAEVPQQGNSTVGKPYKCEVNSEEIKSDFPLGLQAHPIELLMGN